MFMLVLKAVFTLVVGALYLWIPTAVAGTIAAQMFIKLAPNYADLVNVGLITFLTYSWARAVIASIESMVAAVRKYIAIKKATEEKRAEYEAWLKRQNANIQMKKYRKPTDRS